MKRGQGSLEYLIIVAAVLAIAAVVVLFLSGGFDYKGGPFNKLCDSINMNVTRGGNCESGNILCHTGRYGSNYFIRDCVITYGYDEQAAPGDILQSCYYIRGQKTCG
jgi:hypothetical protein